MKTYLHVASLLALLVSMLNFNAYAALRNNETCDIQPGRPLTNSYGPFDYINPSHKDKLPLVVSAHFPSHVERLIRGNTSGRLEVDIDYTLRAIPNHHRALNSMARFERARKKPRKILDSIYSIDCYFKRAMYFQPADATAKMLYGIHLHTLKKYEEAEKYYLLALEIGPNNPEANYNLGLLYLDMDRLQDAIKHATVAYKGGYPLPGLQTRIQRKQRAISN